MKKVTGIGGVFFKAREPEKLRAWYQQYLGIECNEHGAADFNGAKLKRRTALAKRSGHLSRMTRAISIPANSHS